MPADQHSPVAPDEAAASGESSAPSRRSVLRGAAGVGAAGVAATAFMGLPAFAEAARPAHKPETDRAAEAAEAGEAGQEAAAPIVVHLRDARSGQLDLYQGTSQVTVHDADLAARLVRASQSQVR